MFRSRPSHSNSLLNVEGTRTDTICRNFPAGGILTLGTRERLNIDSISCLYLVSDVTKYRRYFNKNSLNKVFENGLLKIMSNRLLIYK